MNPTSCLIFLTLACVLGPVRTDAWQPASAPANGAVPGQQSPSSAAVPPVVPGTAQRNTSGQLLLRTEAGELIPLQELLGGSYSTVLDEILQRGRQQLTVPPYEVKQMELTGAIDGDVLRLTTELQISVRKEQEWVTVPLAFSDLHITDFSHTADAADALAVPETTDPARKQWHLLGAGMHTIRLQLIGKARQLTPGVHTLVVSLPRSTISHASFEFSSPVEIQRLPADSVDRQVAAGAGTKSVEFWGLAPAFSMTWADILPTVARKSVIQVQNRMKLDLTTIPVGLSGTQTLQISGSPVGELNVAFPPGFQLLELGARNQTGESVLNSFDVEAGAEGAVAAIRLTSPVEGTLTLNYDMELVGRLFPQDVGVRLPVVRKANVQSGDLDILIPQGLLVQETQREAAQRKRVASSDTDSDVSATAFRLRSAESRVAFHIEEFDAQFTIAPEMVFQPETGNVLLTARFPVNVLRGSLLDLTIHWAGYTGGEWQLLPGTTHLVTDKQTVPLSMQPTESDPDTFRLTFSERQSGQFRVEFKAFAPIASLRLPSAGLICPEVVSRSREPIVIRTVESDEYSLQPMNTETSRPLAPAPFQSIPSVTVGAEKNSRTWIHDPPAVPIRFDMIPQAPSVSASMVVGLTPGDTGIVVRQEIHYLIEHSDLLTLSLNVPEGIIPDVRIANDPEPLRATLDTATNWSFRMPRSQRGALTIVVSYLWPIARSAGSDRSAATPVPETTVSLPGEFSATPGTAVTDATAATDSAVAGAQTGTGIRRLELPLVQPQPQASVVMRCQVGTSASNGLRVQEMARWQPIYSERYEAAWSAEGATLSIPLEWQQSASLVAATSPDFLLSRTTLTAVHAVTTTMFVFENRPSQFAFLLPAGVPIESIRVDGQLVRTGLYTQPLNNQTRWIIRLPEIASAAATPESSSGAAIAAVRASADRVGPVTIEIQTSEQIARNSTPGQTTEFVRPEIIANASSIPAVWIFEPGDSLRVVSTSREQTTLTDLAQSILPSARGSQTIDEQIRAILSPYPAGVQLLVRDRAERWSEMPARRELYFMMADSGPLRVSLIPGVSLLLISASVCALFFILMTILRTRSIAIPLLVLVFIAPAMYLAFPDWTVVILPNVVIGVLFGIVSLTFQRLAGHRRLRLPGRNPHGDMLTVFGFSGFLADSSAAGRSDVVAAPMTGASVSTPR